LSGQFSSWCPGFLGRLLKSCRVKGKVRKQAHLEIIEQRSVDI
jgi:hypothetical protein